MRRQVVGLLGYVTVLVLVAVPFAVRGEARLRWSDMIDPNDYFGGWPSNGLASKDQNGREASLSATLTAGDAPVLFSLSNGHMLDENEDGLRDYPRIDQSRNLGYPDKFPYLFMQKTVDETRQDDVDCSIQFSHPGGVKHLRFVLHDIDRNSSTLRFTRWVDRVVLTGVTPNGFQVTPTLSVLGGSTNVTVDGNLADGMAAADDKAKTLEDAANVLVDFGDTIVAGVTLSYRLAPKQTGFAHNYPTGNQGLGIGSLTFDPLGRVGGVVFADLNRNGARDAFEPGLPGIGVVVTDGDGETQVVETDLDGVYLATVFPGDVTILVKDSDPDIPANSVLSAGDNPQTVSVAPLALVSVPNVGFYYPNATVSGLVFDDLNRNGVLDLGEAGVGGVVARLSWAGDDGVFGTADDAALSPIMTGADGVYTFSLLPEGAYRVDFDLTSLPGAFVPANTLPPLSVVLSPGEDRFDIHYALVSAEVALSDAVVVSDINRPGLLDAGDTVSFALTVRNPSTVLPFSANVRVPLADGLAQLAILSCDNGDLTGSTSRELAIDGLVAAPGETAWAVFTAVVCLEAANNAVLMTTAYVDGNEDGVADLSDAGSAGPVTKSTAIETIDSGFCTRVYTIETAAGTGAAGFAGEGTAAISAQFNFPTQACVDAENNLYIADRSNHVVRKLDRTSGAITTAAGKPRQRGYAGDGGMATDALLALPSDVCVSGDSLYIAEMGNHVIRKVDLTSGAISTVAGNGTQGYSGDGGTATAAQLNAPRAVAVDVAGNVFIADTFNFAIRRIDAATGVIDSIAGNGTAGFTPDGAEAACSGVEWVMDLALSSGCGGESILYFSEQADYNTVRRLADGRLETVAGRPGADALGDCGPANQAGLNKPYGIAFDTRGNLYIADTENNKIRMVDAESGLITTIAGTGAAGSSGDGGPGIAAELNAPTGIVVGSDNVLFVIDRGNHRVRSMDLSASQEGEQPSLPVIASGVIDRFAGTGEAGYNGEGPNPATRQLSYPGRVAVDASGNVYIADRSNHRIRKVSTNWSIATIAGNGLRGYTGDGGPAVNAQLNFPTDLAVAADGTVFFSDQYNHVIRRIDPTGAVSTVAGTGTAGFNGDGPALSVQFNYPDGLELFGNTLYISDWMNHRARALDLASGRVTTVAGTGAAGVGGENAAATLEPLNTPQGLGFDAATGNLYIAERGNNRVRRLSAEGMISTAAGSGIAGYSGDGGSALAAQLSRPMDVCVGPAGDLFIAEYGSHVIRTVDPLGVISTVAGTGLVSGYSGDGGPAAAALLNSPIGVALDVDSDLLISDRLNHVVRVIGH